MQPNWFDDKLNFTTLWLKYAPISLRSFLSSLQENNYLSTTYTKVYAIDLWETHCNMVPFGRVQFNQNLCLVVVSVFGYISCQVNTYFFDVTEIENTKGIGIATIINTWREMSRIDDTRPLCIWSFVLQPECQSHPVWTGI